MKIQFFKHTNSFKKRQELNPNLYWKVSIGGLCMVIIAASFFGYYSFVETNKDPVLSSIPSTGLTETVNVDTLSKVLENFSVKEKKSTDIVNSPAPVNDPSI